MATSLVHSLGLALPALTSVSRGPPSLLPHALSKGEATPKSYSFPMSKRLNIRCARQSATVSRRAEVPPLGLELLAADVATRVALAEDLHRGVASRRSALHHEPANADHEPRDHHPPEQQHEEHHHDAPSTPHPPHRVKAAVGDDLVTRLPTVEHHITSPARPSRPPPPRYRVGLAMGADEDYIGGVSTEELCRKNHFCR